MEKNESIQAILNQRRFLDMEKSLFIDSVKDLMEHQGYDAVVSRDKSGRITSSNILFGNIHEAKMVVVSYYDTPMRMPSFLKYTPLNFKQKVWNNFILRTMKETVTVLVGIICFSIASQSYWSNGHFQAMDIIMLLFVISSMIAVKTLLQLPSRNFAKRNNSSLEVMIQIMLEIDKSYRDNVLFIFTDNGTADMQGDRVIADTLVQLGKDIPVVMLDSVSAEGELIVQHMDSVKKLVQQIDKTKMLLLGVDTVPQETIKIYQNALLITRGKKVKKQFIIEHINSNKDTMQNEEHLAEAKKVVMHLIKHINK